MPRMIQNIHLSYYQSLVMLLAFNAETPELAAAELGNQDPRIEPNILGARDQLAKNPLALIEVGDNSISVSEKGIEVMKDEGLLDQSGMEVSQKGQEILDKASGDGEMGPDEKGPQSDPLEDPTGTEMAPPTAGGEMETTPGDMGMPPMESLKWVNDLTKLK